jgi:hypothetical protein
MLDTVRHCHDWWVAIFVGYSGACETRRVCAWGKISSCTIAFRGSAAVAAGSEPVGAGAPVAPDQQAMRMATARAFRTVTAQAN